MTRTFQSRASRPVTSWKTARSMPPRVETSLVVTIVTARRPLVESMCINGSSPENDPSDTAPTSAAPVFCYQQAMPSDSPTAESPSRGEISTPSVSVLVPSYRRPEYLRRCLAGLATQDRCPDEVIVVHRVDDEQTIAACSDPDLALGVQLVPVDVSGVVAALNAGMRACRTEIVAITDDDVVARHDWLARIVATLQSHPDAIAVGGRDLVHHRNGVIEHGQARVVGRIQWFGRIVGNHHLDIPPGARHVDALKGANMAWWRSALEGINFDERLRGDGAQVHWELALCLAARHRGKILYDSGITVDHYGGPRFDEDGRLHCSSTAVFNAAYNEAFIINLYLPLRTILPYTAWAVLLGSRRFPGLLLTSFAREEGLPRLTALRGRLTGIREGLRERRRQRQLYEAGIVD